MIELEDTANNVNYEIQIKANDNSKFDNLKYEPKDKGSSSARLGKATGEYVDDLVEFYGIRNWKRRHQDYPKNQEEFDETQKKDYLDNFNWFPFWLKRNFTEILEHIITMLLPIILILVFFKKNSKKLKLSFENKYIFILFVLISFIFWFNFSPVYRFAIPYFLSLLL